MFFDLSTVRYDEHVDEILGQEEAAFERFMEGIDAAGIDVIWFGVMACFVISLGLLTPPVGLVAFSAATAARTPVGPVFRPCLTFSSIAALVVVAAMMIFPGIATWLPSHLN